MSLTLAALCAATTSALLPIVLVDNGSKRAAAALTLRESATALSRHLGGREVLTASLAFSDSIPAAELGGVRARTLNETLLALNAQGSPGAVVAPLFLGQSGGLRRTLDACAATLAERSSGSCAFELRVGACLVDDEAPHDDRVARALASHVLRVARRAQLLRAPASALRVVVCDHGTPSRRVHAVRQRLEA